MLTGEEEVEAGRGNDDLCKLLLDNSSEYPYDQQLKRDSAGLDRVRMCRKIESREEENQERIRTNVRIQLRIIEEPNDLLNGLNRAIPNPHRLSAIHSPDFVRRSLANAEEKVAELTS